MKKIITILILTITSLPFTNSLLSTFNTPHCRNPFSNFGNWPYYSFDYYDQPYCPKAYDDYYA